MSGTFTLNCDGGSRGNPGPGGAGIVITAPEGGIVCSGGRFLGSVTNNMAEYEALIWGLETARSRGIKDLTVLADSELVVKQMNGVYRVKHAGLKPLYERARSAAAAIGSVRFKHVRREQNKAADELANRAMDAMATVGDAPWPACDGPQGTLFD